MKLSPYDLSLQRPTWAEVNLDLLHSNYIEIKRRARRSEVLAVVKSDAYGHGSEVISKELDSLGVRFFGTATAMEGVELRRAGIQGHIILLSGIVPDQIPVIFEYQLTPSIHNRVLFDALVQTAAGRQQEISVHLKVDTGMGRLGMPPEEAAALLHSDHPFVKIEGLYTHMANADLPGDDFTQKQLQRFAKFLADVRPKVRYVHAANSAAVLNYPESHFDLVRPGLLLYGGSPADESVHGFQPILSLRSKIISLRRIQKGQTIGYGRLFCAERDSVIATVPFGYADGLRRTLSNTLDVEIRGTMCRIAGAVSMDLCMVDVTDIGDQVQLNDDVTFIGPKNSMWHWARLLNTVPYEITCLIGARVPRVYYKAGTICDVYFP